MAKYGQKAGQKVARALHERKHGTLRSGSGRKVTSRRQAIAIGLSEAREAGGKVPPAPRTRQRASGAKKTSVRKAGAKKTGAKKTGAKKTGGRKTAARKR